MWGLCLFRVTADSSLKEEILDKPFPIPYYKGNQDYRGRYHEYKP